MKRLAAIAAVAATITALSAGAASAQQGAPGVDIKENRALVKVDGPGFRAKINKHDLRTRIDDENFGIPEAGFSIARNTGTIGVNTRPFVCENGTYRLVAPTPFPTVVRLSSNEPRPLPYSPAFNAAFPGIMTFVGTIDTIVQNERGERFRLMATDIAHEVITPTSFSSIAPIHAFFVDEDGRVVDRASLVGLVNVDRTTGQAVHQVIDSGTCHQRANLGLPGADQAVVFGPFFVLPFNTTVVTR